MPVTHAHPAAVLPLIAYGGRFFNAPALVIGSLMPDFPSFITLPLAWKATHSTEGLMLYCLPAGLIAYGLYKMFLRPGFLSFLELSPEAEEESGPANWREHGYRLMILCGSLLVGAASHVFWDGFTHHTGWAVPCFAALQEPLVPGISLPLCRLLQYLSGVLGTAAVAYQAFRKLRKNSRIPWHSAQWRSLMRRRCLAWFATGVVAGSLAAAIALNTTKKAIGIDLQVRYLVVYNTDAFLLLLAGQGILARFTSGREKEPVYFSPASRK
jgi:hypothetical protein